MGSRFWQTLRLGLKSLLLHKLRSALAILGILIGVTAVIWLVALGEGVSYQAQQQIKDLGANNIIIRSIKPPTDSSRPGGGRSLLIYGLLRDDFKRIVQTIPAVRHATPLREIRKEVRNHGQSIDARLVGCTSDYLGLANLAMERGRFLSDRDLDRVDNVAVIADAVAEKLFGYEDPIGQTIQLDKDVYTVVGQTSRRDPSGNVGGSFSGQDYNQDVYIPLTTLRSRIGDQVNTSRAGGIDMERVELSQITVTVAELSQVDDTADIIRTLLEKFHKSADFGITVPKELLRQAEVLQMMFHVLLVLIGGIALLVGGIGIMNIMLATVTERTREIGIRRALGAKQSDIVQQFLSETVVLSGTGGILGVLLGAGCKPAVQLAHWAGNVFAPETMKALPPNIRDLEPRIALSSVIAAFLISVLVGIFFGLYPAFRAAKMDPIEALRHE